MAEKLNIREVNATNSDDPYNYTFYVFARSWPGSVCLFEECSDKMLGEYDERNFNMHGLWPSGSGDDYCEQIGFCAKLKYEEDQLDDELV